MSLKTAVMKPQRQIGLLPIPRERPCRYLHHQQIGTHPGQTRRTYSPQRLICPRHLRTALLIIPLQVMRRSHREIYPLLPQICFTVHHKRRTVTPLHQQRALQELLFTVNWRVSGQRIILFMKLIFSKSGSKNGLFTGFNKILRKKNIIDWKSNIQPSWWQFPASLLIFHPDIVSVFLSPFLIFILSFRMWCGSVLGNPSQTNVI